MSIHLSSDTQYVLYATYTLVKQRETTHPRAFHSSSIAIHVPSISPRTHNTYSSPHRLYEHKERRHIHHHGRARPNGRNFIILASSRHVDASTHDDERAMTRRGPSVDDELGELRVRGANAIARDGEGRGCVPTHRLV